MAAPAPLPVTVVVVSWNTRALLDTCLSSLAQDFDDGLAEVWVVDNQSGDGSAELVRERHPWARVLEPGANLGFGRAVNLVAEQTQSPWLAIANADVVLEPGALERLLAAGAEDSDAGAIAPRLILPDGSTQHSVHAFPTVPFTLLFNSGLAHLLPGAAERLCLEGAWDPERPRRVDWAVGAFLLVRREAWNAAGGFDPRQWLYAEDLDLGWRLARAGWGTRYEPAASVRHDESAATSAAWGEERTERWMWSTYAWMLRRRGLLRTRLVAVLNWMGALARAALLMPLPWARGPERSWRRHQMLAWARLHRTCGLARSERLRSIS
jgi:GT2 family glycosyltransferase